MSNLKCPFCQQELDIDIKGECGCTNAQCQKSVFMFGTEELWQELIRTRKALDVAVDALREIHLPKQWCPVFAEQEIAKKALDEITALEQKESEFVHNKIKFPEYNDNLLEEFDKQFFENGQDDDLTETALEQKDK